MSITYVGAGTPNSSVGSLAWPADTTMVPTIPAGTTDGDLMVLVAHASSAWSSGGNNPTMDTPSGWTVVDEAATASATRATRVKIMYRRFVAGDSAPTVTFTAGTGTPSAATYWANIYTYRGVKASGNPWNVKNTGTGNSATASVTGVTTTVDWCMVSHYSSYSDDGALSSWTCTSPSGLTEAVDVDTGTGQFGFAQDLQATQGATGNVGVSSAAGGDPYADILVAWEPAVTAHNVAVGTASESDSAPAITARKAKALGIASESDSAIAFHAVKTKLLGAAAESSSAQAISRSKARALGIAAESDSARPMGKVLGLLAAAESDSALGMTARKGRNVVVGTASESDSAMGVAWAPKRRLLGVAAESDAAQSLTRAKARALGLASEADAARAIVRAKSRALGIAAEVDSALALARAKVRALGVAGESDTALSFTVRHGHQLVVGTAAESDSARAIVTPKRIALGTAAEADFALAIPAPTYLPRKSLGVAIAAAARAAGGALAAAAGRSAAGAASAGGGRGSGGAASGGGARSSGGGASGGGGRSATGGAHAP